MKTPHIDKYGNPKSTCRDYLPKPKSRHIGVIVMCSLCGAQYYGYRGYASILWRSVKDLGSLW